MAALPFPSALRQPEWVAHLLRQLAAEPVPFDSLLARLRVDFPDVSAEEVEAHLLERATTHETPNGWVDLLAAADGTILTHVLTATEREQSVLIADGDLDLWARLAGGGMPFAGGGEIHTRRQPDTASGAEAELVGPPGWLEPYRVGQLLGMRLSRGVLELVTVEPSPSLDPARARPLLMVTAASAWHALAAYLAVREADRDVEPAARIGWAVADLVAAHPGILTVPQPPVPHLLRLGGLVVQGGKAILPGVPPDPLEAAILTDAEVRARVAVAAYARAWAGGDPVAQADGALFLNLVVGPGVLEHLADLVECDPLPGPALERLRHLARTPVERAVVELLASRSAEGAGWSAQAEELVNAALLHDPELLPAVLDAAEYAATRGDVVAAEGFLKRAGLSNDDPRRVALAKVVTPPATPIARGQLCPCGSGKKYRRCCLRLAVHALPVRAALIYARLAWYAHRAPRRGTVTWLEQLEARDRSRVGLLSIDLAIFDVGILDDYLAARGHLLREDERRLVERWRGTRILPYEVTAVREGASLRLRPLRDDADGVWLRNRPVARGLLPGDLLVARILHDGQRPSLIVPPRTVPRDRAAELRQVFTDYTPLGLAAFFGSLNSE